MAHIIVVGNEKGGSGKSTTSMHLATALVRMGHRVGTLDLDLRQKSLGRYIENRRHFVEKSGIALPTPVYAELPEVSKEELAPGENVFDRRLSAAVATMEGDFDFILIDCPGSHTRLSQVAHSLADTLVSPLNDSFVDFDLLGPLRPGHEPHPRAVDLFRDGVERAAAARAGGAEAHRLGRGAQPRADAGHAQQGEDGRRARRTCAAHRVPRGAGLLRSG